MISFLVLFLLSSSVLIAQATSGGIDATTVVNNVVDGDTFDTTTKGRIRLADIDAPESWEHGYSAAKSVLSNLVNSQTVYLDIDDVYGTDPYGRLVCVVYVSYNSTHYQNVNKALLDEGVAVVDNYDNEFNPYAWTRYVHEDFIPEFPTPILLLVIFSVATTLVVVVYRKKWAK